MTEAVAATRLRPLLPPDIPLNDNLLWADEAALTAALARLRREVPVCWVDEEPYRPYWAVTRYADAKAVLEDHETFINSPRLALAPKAVEAAAEAAYGGKQNRVRTVHDMDEPDHKIYRDVTQRWFVGTGVLKFQARIDAIVDKYIQRMIDLGGECDFARDIANWLPLDVILSILGLPEEDAPFILRITQQLFAAFDPDVKRSDAGGADVVADFYAYFSKVIEARRANPGEDLASVIANAQINGGLIKEVEAISYFLQIATAGHETTAASLAAGMRAFIEHPDEADKIRADPRLMRSGADEIVRWATPIRHICRTATRDTTVGGVPVVAGESLAVFYPSINRDESAFDAPFTFDILRPAEHHLAFSTGIHMCLGRQLALAEIRSFFARLLPRLAHAELAGPMAFFQSNFVGGYKKLPIRYVITAA